MPKLKPDTQRARREHILDAAEQCFARSGFHRCTMQEICKEAGVSPGALYVYFSSKEDLIAGISERERQEFQDRFAKVAEADDFLEALNGLAAEYFVDEPIHRRRMCIEIGVESTRNETVGELFRAVDREIVGNFETLFQRMKTDGRIAPKGDVQTLAKVFAIIGDGLIWRRATDPNFDAQAVLPTITELVRSLLNVQEPPAAGADKRPEKSQSNKKATA